MLSHGPTTAIRCTTRVSSAFWRYATAPLRSLPNLHLALPSIFRCFHVRDDAERTNPARSRTESFNVQKFGEPSQLGLLPSVGTRRWTGGTANRLPDSFCPVSSRITMRTEEPSPDQILYSLQRPKHRPTEQQNKLEVQTCIVPIRCDRHHSG